MGRKSQVLSQFPDFTLFVLSALFHSFQCLSVSVFQHFPCSGLGRSLAPPALWMRTTLACHRLINHFARDKKAPQKHAEASAQIFPAADYDTILPPTVLESRLS
jgi:hypothetical protein